MTEDKAAAGNDSHQRPVPRPDHPIWRLLIALILAVLLALLAWFASRSQPVYYVPDQLVLSGPSGDVKAAVQILKSRYEGGQSERTLVLIDSQPLTFLQDLRDECPGIPTDEEARKNYVVNHYQIGGIAPVEDLLQDLATVPELVALQIGGDANLVTGRPPIPSTGDPWGAEGSPWGAEGSPWGAEGSPSGDAIRVAASKDYLEQWAFDNIALLPVGQGQAKPLALGKGVTIGIFDTSPFPITVLTATLQVSSPLRADSVLELGLFHPIRGGRPPQSAERPDVADHGLFAAGLAYSVAPNSRVQLIRVLDDTGQGDLQTLNRALVDFITRARPDYGPRVINLSLGLHPPPDASAEDMLDVDSLQTILAAAQCQGMVVVAASGNDSADLSAPAPMQIPAAWPNVLGIAASNRAGRLSCFSNDGEVAAPGGDGGPNAQQCQQMIKDCIEHPNAQCDYGLMGPGLASATGFLFWNGSSFAAPLVSGQAALLLEQGLSPEQVLQQIKNTAVKSADHGSTLSKGVVNIEASTQ